MWISMTTSKMMKTGIKQILHIDIETYSNVDLIECGVYRYCDDPSFEILIIGYAYNDEDVEIIDIAQGQKIPDNFISDLTNSDVIKVAHNANFERTCLSRYLGLTLQPEQWLCTAIWASRLGLPRSLKDVGAALGLADDEVKLKTGKALISYFSKPCKATKANGGRTRNMPTDDIDKWALYLEYNKQDVVAERAIMHKLEVYGDTTVEEHSLWCLDQKINDYGVLVDKELIDGILTYSDQYRFNLLARAKEISGLDNPQSISQAKKWLMRKGLNLASLTKDIVIELVKTVEDPEVLEFLKIRQELGKTSVTKYEAMARSVCSDGRIKGMLQFYGASRTGRWAGRIVQLQNLPQNKITDIHFARNLVKCGDFDVAELCYSSMMNLFSQLIRTALIPGDSNVFVVADYSAIEARVIAWLAGEKWVQEVFATHGKIYEATASQMFHVPIEKVTHGSDLRKKGKIAQLACGYGGSVGALKAMDSKGDIPENEMQGLIDAWRKANPHIVQFWWDCEGWMKSAILNPGTTIKGTCGLRFKMIKDTLFVKLPSGRKIAYRGAKVVEGGYTGKSIRYMGQNQTTQKWEEVETYGGKIVENIVQATARDILGYAMLLLDSKGLKIVAHVHDEVIVEVPKAMAKEDMERICILMKLENVEWAKGLILKAEGYTCDFYMKD